MSGIDNRIVSMKFDNAGFERGIGTTLGSLAKLKESLKFSGASKGLTDLQTSAGRFNLNPIEGAVTGVSKSFLAMSTVAITALANITNRAISAGASVVKSLTIDPIKTGFEEYEQKIGAIQTIMDGSGESIKTVNKYLQELNTYSDKTIYSFSNMTENIGKFTNAGISLKDSVAAIKGVANVAAISGANADEAARSMYNFAQALSSGSVRLADWKSIELANMATKGFKDELIKTAVAAGTLEKSADGMFTTMSSKHQVDLSATKGFNESLTEQWLTTEVLTKTLKRYSDTNTEVGKKATAAAQDVKTFSQLLDTLRESAGSGWAQSFELIFGGFDDAKTLFTGINNVLGKVISDSSAARNKILSDWNTLGGRTALIDTVSNVFKSLGSVLKPIKDAFRDIFPATTGKQLADLTKRLRDFTARLTLSDTTAENLKRTFRGVFAVFSIIKQVVVGVASVFGRLIGALSSGTGGILKLTGGVGDFLVSIDTALKKGGLLTKLFNTIGNAVAVPVRFIGIFVSALGSLATGGAGEFLDGLKTQFSNLGPTIEKLRPIFDSIESAIQNIGTAMSDIAGKIGNLFNFGGKTEQATTQIDQVKTSLAEVPSVLDSVKAAWDKITAAFKNVGTMLAPVWETLKGIFLGLKDKLVEFVSNMGVEEGLAIVNTGFFIALYSMLRKFFGSFKQLIDSYSGTFDSISGVLDQVTSNLKTMQADVKADIILKIAAALALLAAALFVLSKIDAGKLAISLTAVGVMLGMLVKALIVLEKNTSVAGAAKLTLMSVGILALGVALSAMAGAVAILGNMDLKTLVKGMSSIGLVLAIIVAATNFLGKTGGATQLIIAAAGIMVLAVALTTFAAALKLYSKIDISTMVSGGIKIAAALSVIALTMRAMPKNMLASSAALFIVANALVILSGALKILGGMSPKEMAKSLIMLGGGLLIIAAALHFMTGAVGGAAAILLFAAALNILVPPLLVLGRMSLKQIGIALLALVGVFVVLGAAAFVLAPLVPVIDALAAAIALLGLGIMLVGGGLLAFATGLGILAASGAAGAAVLVGAIVSIAEIIPLLAQQLGMGLLAFAKVISEGGPAIVAAISTLLDSLLTAMTNVLPKVAEFALKLMDTILRVLVSNIPKIARAGIKILIGFLTAIKNNIQKVVELGGDIIVKFINGIANNLVKIVNAGANLIVKFIKGISNNLWKIIDAGVGLIKDFLKGIAKKASDLTDAGFDAIIAFIKGVTRSINSHAGELRSAGRDLAKAIIDGMTGGLASGLGRVVDKAKEVARGALNAAKNLLGIGSPSKEFYEIGRFVDIGLANGLSAYAHLAENASEDTGRRTVTAMRKTLSQLSNVMTDDVDPAPVIAPVLDLTKFKKDAGQINSYLSSKPFTAAIALDTARTISLNQGASSTEDTSTRTEPVVQNVKFEQNNYSPRVLSTVDIYRQTKNQLSLAKEALSA